MKYINFNLPNKIAISVSGGKDSMSLALHTRNIYKDIQIICLIINHNLRQESLSEAEYVRDILMRNKIETYILHWKNAIPSQSHARNARYDLLCAKCYELSIDTLLVGHHMDDMIETYIMRKEKNSGPRGLASIHCVNYIHGIKILRPLILNYKDEIIPMSEWVEDPSNKNLKFKRVEIRNRIKDKEKIIEEIKYFSSSRKKNDILIFNTLKDHIFIDNDSIYVNKNILFSLPKDLIDVAVDKIVYFISNKFVNIKNFSLDKRSYGLSNMKSDNNNIVFTRQKRRWPVILSTEEWVLSPCRRFFIKEDKSIKIIQRDIFSVWYCPFESDKIIKV